MKKVQYRIDSKGRVCTKCGKYKLWDEYNYSGGLRRRLYRSSSCKDCHRLYCRSKVGQVIDYINGICYYPEEKEPIAPIPVRYEAPNIDEEIGFISVTEEEDE